MDSINPIAAAAVHLISRPHPYAQQINEDEEGENVICRNRERTDFPFLVVLGISFLALAGLIGYCVATGDIDRIIIGHDKCGNVCGKINSFTMDYDSWCKAEDMTMKPFLDVSTRTCVETCPPDHTVFGKRCLPVGRIDHDTTLNSIGRDFQICTSQIVGLTFVALAFSLIMLLVLRYFTAAFVWTVLFGVVFGFAALTGWLWYLTETSEAIMPMAIGSSICTIILVLVVLVLRRRIELVIQLLKEAGKSITAVPLLLIKPILTCVALGIAALSWIYFTLWIESAGTVRLIHADHAVYHKNGLQQFVRWFNIFMLLWIVQFIYGCQNMIIAGVISRWYFARNKATLRRPILESASDVLRYHLGTISLGSLLIVLVQMLRIALRVARRFYRRLLYMCCLCCVATYIDECVAQVERFLKFLTRNAYIVTSIHGTEFLKSGTKALSLILDNILQIAVINSVGDFVFILTKVLIVLVTLSFGVLMTQDNLHVQNQWAVLLLVGAVAYLIAHCFVTVYEMAVDTIFICFCEDCEMNDGMARPYYMSHCLMEFVEKSRTVMNVKQDESADDNRAVIVN